MNWTPPRSESQPNVKALLAEGDVLLGTFIGLASPVAAELLAHSGFEVLCIDGEHAAMGPSEIEDLVRATEGGSAAPLVRVGGPGPEVAHALDAGAIGVVFPRVDSAEMARECAAQTRYPPLGNRGAGPGRASGYGANTTDYIEWANDHVLAVAQVETLDGLEAVHEIVDVEGIDGILIGPNDLAVSLGVDRGSSTHLDAIDTILAASHRGEKPSAILCSPNEVANWLDKGVLLIFIQSDLGLLRVAAGNALAQASATRAQSA